jgi:hypothetical protein
MTWTLHFAFSRPRRQSKGGSHRCRRALRMGVAASGRTTSDQPDWLRMFGALSQRQVNVDWLINRPKIAWPLSISNLIRTAKGAQRTNPNWWLGDSNLQGLWMLCRMQHCNCIPHQATLIELHTILSLSPPC